MTDIYSQADLRQLCEPWLSSIRPNHRFKVYTDTTDIFRIEYGDILMLNDAPYLIMLKKAGSDWMTRKNSG